MEDLLRAFQVFRKYTSYRRPTTCEHDVLYVLVKAEEVSTEDIKTLENLGFDVDENTGNFRSDRFGSA